MASIVCLVLVSKTFDTGMAGIGHEYQVFALKILLYVLAFCIVSYVLAFCIVSSSVIASLCTEDLCFSSLCTEDTCLLRLPCSEKALWQI